MNLKANYYIPQTISKGQKELTLNIREEPKLPVKFSFESWIKLKFSVESENQSHSFVDFPKQSP